MNFRIEVDSLGEIKVPADKLWGAQTQRALEYFSIGNDRIPCEMVTAYAILKKAAAIANHSDGHLPSYKKELITKVCDEIIAEQHAEMFPLCVWISGSGTQFNMNINEVISNRCCQLTNQPLGTKKPIHPNDDVNLSQSTNDSFPSAIHIAVAIGVTQKLIPALKNLRDSLNLKAQAWKNIVKIGRTHMQDATPLTLGQEFSGYASMLDDNLARLEQTLSGAAGVYCLALGGTAVGTGVNAVPNFDCKSAYEIAQITNLPFITASNKFAVQGSHDALVQLSSTLKTLASSLYKIANDIRLLSCGPRSGFYELIIPSNEPGSSIMPGKINPTQCEALTMVAIQVMANDVAITFGGAGGLLEMNTYKPLIMFNLVKSIRLLSDSMNNFRRFLVDGIKPNEKHIATHLNNSLMLVTALTPAIGYDNASRIAHYALDNNLSLKAAALKLGLVSSTEFDRLVDPHKMIGTTF